MTAKLTVKTLMKANNKGWKKSGNMLTSTSTFTEMFLPLLCVRRFATSHRSHLQSALDIANVSNAGWQTSQNADRTSQPGTCENRREMWNFYISRDRRRQFVLACRLPTWQHKNRSLPLSVAMCRFHLRYHFSRIPRWGVVSAF